MNLQSMIEFEGKVSYEVEIENEQNEITKLPVEFDSSERTDKKAFCVKLSESGRYAFYGSQDQLQMLWMYITMNHHQLEGVIRRRSYLGYLEDDDVWLFENCAISDGEVFLADERGDIKIGNDIFRSDDIDIYSHKKPRLFLDKNTTDSDIEEIIKHYWTVLDYREGKLISEGEKGYNNFNAFLAIGWLIGNVYLQEWVHEVGFFPFIELYGQKGSGKTYAMQILMMMFGLDQEKARETWGGSRANIAESMKYLGNMPYYLDEYVNRPDNDPKQNERIGFLRNTYNRTPYTRGKGTGGKEILPLRSTFCFTGQARPNDAALLSRSVIIWKHQYHKKGQESFKWLWKEHAHELSRMLLYVLKNKTKVTWNRIKDNYDFFSENLENSCPNVDIRQRGNYAVLAASFFSLSFMTDRFIEPFCEWLINEIKSGYERIEGENIVYQFLANLDTIFQNSIREVISYEKEGEIDYLYIAYSEAFSEWRKRSRELSVSEDITEKELKEYMKNDPAGYYIELGRKNKHYFGTDVGRTQKRAIKINIEKLPENLRDAVRWGYMAE